jgi:hypothetical protein
MAKTQITTGRVRFSYVNAFHPRADQNGVEKYSGEHKKQQNSQTAVFRKDHKENTAKLAGVCKHADDTGSKKFLYCIHITYKTGSNGS